MPRLKELLRTDAVTRVAKARGAHATGGSLAVLQELAKFVIVFFILTARKRPWNTLSTTVRRAVDWKALQLLVPAACYATQNVLYFTALGNIDAGMYQVLSQLKTLFTVSYGELVAGGCAGGFGDCEEVYK